MNPVYVSVGIDGRSIPAGGEAGQILQKASDEDFDLIWTTPAGGASANIPQPASTIPVADSKDGLVGSGVSFARSDHSHVLNVATTGTPVMDGTAALGTATTYARTDHVHPSDTYENGIVIDESNIYNSVDDLPAAGTAGRIAFVIVS